MNSEKDARKRKKASPTDDRLRARIIRPLLFQFADKLLPKFRDLWCHDRSTIWLRSVIRKIFLMVILRGPELLKGRYLRYDRIIINSFLCYILDHIFRILPLLIIVIKDR